MVKEQGKEVLDENGQPITRENQILTALINKHASALAQQMSDAARNLNAEPIVQQLSYMTAALVVLDSIVPVLDPMNKATAKKHLLNILSKADACLN